MQDGGGLRYATVYLTSSTSSFPGSEPPSPFYRERKGKVSVSKSPAFQFYPKDWLSSPKVQLMTPAQEGAYVRLLCYCWDSGDCSLPDDDAELSILSRLGEGWFNGGSTVVRKCFIPHPDKLGYLTNQRILEEAKKQEAWKKKSADGGRKSAAKRADKRIFSKGGSKVVEPKPNRPVEPNGNIASSSASSLLPPTPMLFTVLPPEWKKQAMEEKGWPENVILDIWSGFREYWQTGKGKKTKRQDWAATWRTWYRKENIKQSAGKAQFKPQEVRAGAVTI
jgi:uncharacterized protein YdaU (DUF1376 family)